MFPVAAFILGLLGSLHCVGMCGPIALALPLRRESFVHSAAGTFVYNGGRAITYAVLGAISGLLGSAVKFAAGQQTLSIAAGAIILLTLAGAMFGKRMNASGAFSKIFSGLRSMVGKLFRNHRPGSLLLIGLLNGLLPCGLVYTGLAGAAASGNPWLGALFMFIFGTGTAPAMLALSLAGSRISLSVRGKIRKAVPVFVAVMALLLVLRGLGLGIPYVSPSFAGGKPVCCHCHRK